MTKKVVKPKYKLEFELPKAERYTTKSEIKPAGIRLVEMFKTKRMIKKENKIESHQCGISECRESHLTNKSVDNLIAKAKQELKQKLLTKLEKTKDENYAFMTITNEKGELEDWSIPMSEIKKIIEEIK